MGYRLGVDLGTTYTAAAVQRDGHITMATLGTRLPEIPTVVAYGDAGEVLVGEPAARRAATQPERVAREFKRRVGDPVPIIVAGAPRSAEALMGMVLGHVLSQVSEAEGGPPDEVVVTHPASWGPYKTAQLEQIFQLAGCRSASTITEPEAAARHYAAQSRLEPNSTVAVFDFGGGTFDVAILRYRADRSYELLGEANGLERLGGVDLDHALFGRVLEESGIDLSALEDTTANRNAIALLRRDCVAAKEALSSDTVTVVPIMLPDRHAEVRVTRSEFEELIRPAVVDAIASVEATIEDAGLRSEDISAILLVGGTSRIPLVSELVTDHFNRPTLVDSHPKHSIASGAALVDEHHDDGVASIDGVGGEHLVQALPEQPDPGVRSVHPPHPPALAASPTHQGGGTGGAGFPAPALTGAAPGAAPSAAVPATTPLPVAASPVEVTSSARRSVSHRVLFGAVLVAFVALAGAWLALFGGNAGDGEGLASESAATSTLLASAGAQADATGQTADGLSSAPSSSATSPPSTSSSAPSIDVSNGSDVALGALIAGQDGRRANGLSGVNALPDAGPVQPPQLAWQIASGPFTGPTGLGDMVYASVADDAGIPRLAGFDLETGAQVWIADQLQLSSIIVSDDVIIAHWLRGFRFHDPLTGELLGEMGMPSSFGSENLYVSEAVLRDGRILAAGGHGDGASSTSFVVSLDAATGEAIWTFEDQSLGWTPLDQIASLGSDGTTIVLGGPNAIVAIDVMSGEELWRSVELTGATPLHVDAGILLTQTEPGENVGLDARTGEQVWDFAEILFPRYASDGTNFYVVPFGTSELQARRLATGDIVWSAEGAATSGFTPAVLIGGDLAYVVNDDGVATAFRASSGQLVWSSTLDGMSPVLGGGWLPLFTSNSRLILLQDQTVRVYE